MKKLAIGVDIGGINTAFGLVDENGDLYAESVISTKKYPSVDAVSYTHLDVYKRQVPRCP